MRSIKSQAFSLLARRAYFSKELEEKLRDRGHAAGEIAALIDELTKEGWLDDRELARRFAQRQREKGYGRLLIIQKLRRRAGPLEFEVEDGEADELESLIRRKYAERLPDERHKVVAALLRRGFPYDQIDAALRRLEEEGLS